MTEDEAKTKWCPAVRIASLDTSETTTNRWQKASADNATRCLGSGCMWWRWEIWQAEKHYGAEQLKSFDGYCARVPKP